MLFLFLLLPTLVYDSRPAIAKYFYHISNLWYTFIGAVVCVSVGMLVSGITGNLMSEFRQKKVKRDSGVISLDSGPF